MKESIKSIEKNETSAGRMGEIVSRNVSRNGLWMRKNGSENDSKEETNEKIESSKFKTKSHF